MSTTIKTENTHVTTTTVAPTSTPYGGNAAYQLPVNMSSNGSNQYGAAATSTTSTTRHNVSVTNIKCEVPDEVTTPTTTMPNGNIVPVIASTGGYYNGGMGMGGGMGIRIPFTKAEEDSDSETELTNIENLKVTRRVTSSGGAAVGGSSTLSTFASGCGATLSALNKNGPRPMSWEGELSETETSTDGISNTAAATAELMDTDNSSLSNGAGVAVIKSEATTTTSTPQHQQQQHQQQLSFLNAHPSHVAPPQYRPQPIKPEQIEHITDEIHGSNSGGGGGRFGSSHPHHQQHHPQNHPPKLKLAPTQSDPINLKYEPAEAAAASPLTAAHCSSSASCISAAGSGAANSPLLARNKSAGAVGSTLPLPANPSPDSAIHSVYTHSSPSQSPLTSRHAPYTPSLSRNNSDASHSSCYSYSSEFSPTHSPIQGRHAAPPPPPPGTPLYGSFNGASLHHAHSAAASTASALLYRPITSATMTTSTCSSSSATSSTLDASSSEAQNLSMDTSSSASSSALSLNLSASASASSCISDNGLPTSAAAGISRQQLINSPCPICGDKISGFHYGIFSCESCKGFFKRTVQNRKNYVCVRGGPCPVSISTRKKCPACRFEKCLQKGMKLEAIREDRTRGGRSTYQCSYTLPNALLSPLLSPDQQQQHHQQQRLLSHHHHPGLNGFNGGHGVASSQHIKTEHGGDAGSMGGNALNGSGSQAGNIPVLLQEIMDVEHLWQYNEAELARLNQPLSTSSSSASAASSSSSGSGATAVQMTNPLLASAGFAANGENANPDLIAHLCNIADHRLYKIVKWCKSLPLFKNISIDDQICLLINSWCELLLFSCCYRSIETPGEVKMSQGKSINLPQAKSSGLQACIERMLNLTDHLRRLRVDRYEYVAMKVIVLLQSDTSELQEPVKVRECQEKALQSLQAYTLAHYPDTPSKFGELLLRIPDLQRTCQLSKEMLTIKSRDGGNFNLLMELLRGEH